MMNWTRASTEFVEMRVEIGDRAGERLCKDRGKALAQARVVALARHIDEAGDEAFERVAAHEQRDALALLQVEDADRGVEQLVLGDLEQLVAREGVEDVEQRLAVMALRGEAGALDRAPHLLPQQRDRVRAGAVGMRGEQADEQPHRRRPRPLASKRRMPIASMRDVAVNRGAGVGLGDDQQFAAAHEILHIGRQRGEVAKPAEHRVVASRGCRAAASRALAPAATGKDISRKPR